MAIYFNASDRCFYLEGQGITYAFRVNAWGYLEHLYFGSRIGRDDLSYAVATGGASCEASCPESNYRESMNDLRSELPTYGTGDYRECALQVCMKNGSRISNFLYHTHEILPEKPPIFGMPSLRGGETLVITLKEKQAELYVKLYYTVYEDAPVIARHAEIVNNTEEPVFLTRAFSFCLDLPDNRFDMISLHGAWVTERKPERIPLHHGVVSIDSKRGSSSAVLNPFMAVVERNTDEEHGRAYGINLVYSSSFVLKAECDSKGNTRLIGGINDFDFRWRLEACERFATPEAVVCYSANGLGALSRGFHDVYRTYLINKRYVYVSRPIVINNWEATYFDFDSEKLTRLMDAVKGTGIDTFVLDDGWFGIRSNDKSGLGDWTVNTEKLRGGLQPIIEHAHACGLKFGLWFEPEMVNPDSELYRSHPDWAIHAPNTEPALSRNQLVLDLTRSEVRDYIADAVSAILSTHEIDYVKWDFNRNITENCSEGLPADRQQEFHHRYALGLYDICERIVNGFPNIFFEGCSGGGARFDPGMLCYFPQIWTSDDTDAAMRAEIQYGTSYCYPISSMSCHVSICPNHQTGRIIPFQSRADIAQLGATGYELDTEKMSEGELQMIPQQTNAYRADEALMLYGDLYRLQDPTVERYFGMQLVSKDQSSSKVTLMRTVYRPNDEVKRVLLRGLKADAKYEIRESGLILTGSTLMQLGLVIPAVKGDFRTFVYHLKETSKG